MERANAQSSQKKLSNGKSKRSAVTKETTNKGKSHSQSVTQYRNKKGKSHLQECCSLPKNIQVLRCCLAMLANQQMNGSKMASCKGKIDQLQSLSSSREREQTNQQSTSLKHGNAELILRRCGVQNRLHSNCRPILKG